ncbi:MAG: hypothetical protein EXS13_06905 [Planctomycetes bacterium]|nr:hypothetical protein [Planctomycetota bacterium]
MASGITFGGLASGLDTNAIISALLSVEGRKAGQMRSSKALFQKKIGALDDLTSKMNDLATALKKISDPGRFVAHKASISSGGDDYVSVTPKGDTLAGSWNVKVTTLAESTFIRSDGFADANADLGITGTLSLSVGGTQHDITIDGTNSNLNGMRDAINDADFGVAATTVFDGTDWHLELRGTETGLANTVTIVAEPSQPPPQGPVLNLTQQRAASDAAFTVDSQNYTSASNTVDNAIQGITLQLLHTQDVNDPALQVTVSEDFEAIESQLADFVKEFNDVVSFLNAQSKPRANGDETVQPLAGDSALRSLRSAFGTTVSSASLLPGVGYSSLGAIGIKTKADGTLELDSARLKTVLTDDVDDVKRMLTDTTAGIGKKLLDVVESRTDSIDGALATRKDAYRTSMTTLDERIIRAEDQLVIFEKSLRQRFAAMESLVGRLQAQGGALGSIGSIGLFGSR